MTPHPHSSWLTDFCSVAMMASKRKSLPSHPPELTVWGQPAVAKQQVKDGFSFNVFMVSHS